MRLSHCLSFVILASALFANNARAERSLPLLIAPFATEITNVSESCLSQLKAQIIQKSNEDLDVSFFSYPRMIFKARLYSISIGGLYYNKGEIAFDAILATPKVPDTVGAVHFARYKGMLPSTSNCQIKESKLSSWHVDDSSIGE